MVELLGAFHVHELDENNLLGQYVGGANSATDATAVACACFVASFSSGVSDRIFAVVDDMNVVVAWIGKTPPVEDQ